MNRVTLTVRIATWVVALLSLAFAIFGTVLPRMLGVEFDLSADTALLAFVVAAPVLGLILVLRAGAVRMGALLLAMGFGLGLASLGAGIPSSPDYLEWLPLFPFANVGWMVFLALAIAGLPLLFPSGQPLTRRWRPVLWALLILLPLVSVMALFSEQLTLFCSDVYPADVACSVWEGSDEPISVEQCEPTTGPLGRGTECQVMLDNPIGITGVPNPDSGLVGGIFYVVLLAISTLSVVSLGMRFRRAARQERQQIKFVFFVLGIFVLSTLVEAVVVEFLDRSLPVVELIDFLMWLAIPLSIFLAITRYRLYDIDRLVARTVTYAVVVGLLVASVAAVATLAGAQFQEPWVVAATTLAVAALFNPLRRRIQGWVEHRFNRSRYDAERVMEAFVATLRDRVDQNAVVEGWVGTVSNTMQPSAVGVWVRE